VYERVEGAMTMRELSLPVLAEHVSTSGCEGRPNHRRRVRETEAVKLRLVNGRHQMLVGVRRQSRWLAGELRVEVARV